MSMYYGDVALDLARERNRGLERAAAHHRLLLDAADFKGNGEPPRPRRLRSLIAAPVRAFSTATHAVSNAACAAATRLEGA